MQKQFLASSGSVLLLSSLSMIAQSIPVLLEPYVAFGQRVAIEEPATTFPMPLSTLKYEPIVDVQERSFGEAQGDVAIRGGIFENTGFKIGAATLFDPQTGHYFAELPIAPNMLSAPAILTGADNALYGFNSNIGTIQWNWMPIQTGGEITAGFGSYALNYQNVYGAHRTNIKEGLDLGIDGNYARSESDGPLERSDHDFERYNLRTQLTGGNFQTDFFAGYQDKFFAWPALYTGFNFYESEDIESTLFLLNHKVDYGGDDQLELTAYYRRNVDHYIFNTYNPANQFKHETRVFALGFEGQHLLPYWDVTLTYAGQFTHDNIDSTKLDSIGHSTRRYAKLAFLPEKTFQIEEGRQVLTRLGFSYDVNNKDSSAISPIAEVALIDTLAPNKTNRYFVSFAKTTQVPGYTALNSDPTPGGLFAGNEFLQRERTYNLEAGIDLQREDWSTQAVVFYRWDKDLVDWTFDSASPNARTANPVDIETVGLELIGRYHWQDLELIGSYTLLSKDEDYGQAGATVDASFYGLNYAEHRFTLAGIWKPVSNFELRMDNELRFQRENQLREGTRNPVLSSVGVYFNFEDIPELELSLTVNNLWNQYYEEVPGTRGTARQLTAGATYRF